MPERELFSHYFLNCTIHLKVPEAYLPKTVSPANIDASENTKLPIGLELKLFSYYKEKQREIKRLQKRFVGLHKKKKKKN